MKKRVRKWIFNFVFNFVEENGGALFRFKRIPENEQHLILMSRSEYQEYKQGIIRMKAYENLILKQEKDRR